MYTRGSAQLSYEEAQTHSEAVRIAVRHEEGLPDDQRKQAACSHTPPTTQGLPLALAPPCPFLGKKKVPSSGDSA